MSGPTAAQIASRIDSVLAERPDARTIAISAAKRCEWPPEMVRKGRRFTLRWADSTLAVRDALATLGNAPAEPGNEHPNGLPNGLVLLTPLPATSLGSSLLARLDRGKVHATDRWQTVRDAFQARDVDPRLRRHGWMADILLERIPSGGYPPVSGGVLDIDTAWRHLLRELLDFESERGDVDALLRWTTKGDGPARFAALEGDARDAVRSRVAAIGGLAPAIMALVASGYGGLALPLGLLIRIWQPPAAEWNSTPVDTPSIPPRRPAGPKPPSGCWTVSQPRNRWWPVAGSTEPTSWRRSCASAPTSRPAGSCCRASPPASPAPPKLWIRP